MKEKLKMQNEKFKMGREARPNDESRCETVERNRVDAKTVLPDWQ
jgi:hypothetical protein